MSTVGHFTTSAKVKAKFWSSAAQVGVSRMWKSRIAITSLSPLPIDEEKASSLQLAERLCYTCHTSLISPGGGNMHKATGNRSRVPVPMWIETRLST